MFSASQLVAHLVGDYLLQSHWMATMKTSRSAVALMHATLYSLPFLFFRPSWVAWAFIVGSHFVIDRWRLARLLVWAKNRIAPTFTYADFELPVQHVHPWRESRATGYGPDVPAFLAVWLLIIADNTLHLICNGIALRWL